MKFEIPPNEFNIEFMREHGYVRKKCKSCGSYFWTVIPDQELCGDAPCVEYAFIGKPPTRRSYTLEEMRNTFLKFFEKRGHEIIEPYPVVARWRDDLLVTIASIVDFQPYVTEGLVEPPANPLVVSQPCLRFEDLENVGLTFGRHLTIFEMGGAHAFNFPGKPEIYWKNETIAFHHELATKELGIPEEYITYKEHFWIGGGNAGPDVEGSVLGLEISTLVFMSFKITDNQLISLSVRTVDTGYGIERWCWLSQGKYSAFEAIYGEVFQSLSNLFSIEVDKEILEKTSIISGAFSRDNPELTRSLRSKVAKEIGLDYDQLEQYLRKYEDFCTVLDHSKALLFLITDGAIPSNVREGYLSRLLFRRLYRILLRYQAEDYLENIIKSQIDYWGSQFRKIKEMEDELIDIILNERRKYIETLNRGISRLERIIANYRKKGKKTLSVDDLIVLYDSHGLHPEIVKEISEKKGVTVEIPSNFFSLVAQRHEKEIITNEERVKIRVDKTYKTKRLYYDDPYLSEFEATVLFSSDNFVILDQTAFYPTGGGQQNDTGYLFFNGKKSRVIDVEEVEGNIIHFLDGPVPEKGARVKGVIDWSRRYSLMRNHTATHIILAAARKVLGKHIWQAGAEKTPEKARLDLTHHKKITDEELRKIERLANEIVAKSLPIKITQIKRTEAERKYGTIIYQGGAVPSGIIRIVEIKDWDVEACGGLHCNNTRELMMIKVIGSERVQDGVERIVFTSGDNALKEIQETDFIVKELCSLLGKSKEKLVDAIRQLKEEQKRLRTELKNMKHKYLLLLAENISRDAVVIDSLKIVVFVAGPDFTIDDLIQLGKNVISITPNVIYVGYIHEKGTNGVIMIGSEALKQGIKAKNIGCLLYTSPSPRDRG